MVKSEKLRMFAATCRPSPQYKTYPCRKILLLPCDPCLAELLRTQYSDIIPGFYSDKRNWNSIFLDRAVPDDLGQDLCRLVFSKLLKRGQTALRPNTKDK